MPMGRDVPFRTDVLGVLVRLVLGQRRRAVRQLVRPGVLQGGLHVLRRGSCVRVRDLLDDLLNRLGMVFCGLLRHACRGGVLVPRHVHLIPTSEPWASQAPSWTRCGVSSTPRRRREAVDEGDTVWTTRWSGPLQWPRDDGRPVTANRLRRAGATVECLGAVWIRRQSRMMAFTHGRDAALARHGDADRLGGPRKAEAELGSAAGSRDRAARAAGTTPRAAADGEHEIADEELRGVGQRVGERGLRRAAVPRVLLDDADGSAGAVA